MSSVKDLRKLVGASRLDAASPARKKVPLRQVGQAPIVYGRKRTLAPLKHTPRPTTPAAGFDLDGVLGFLDASYLTLWLQRAQLHLARLREWYAKDDNVVLFSHFWLSEMPDKDRQDLLEMEGQVLLDEFRMALQPGVDAGKVREADLVKLRRAVFSEYPDAFFADSGMGCLDLLHILGCAQTAHSTAPTDSAVSRHRPYQDLLSALKCSTENPQFRQWLLGIRSFCLVSTLHAVVSFFDNLTTMQVAEGFARPGTSKGSRSVLPMDAQRTASSSSPTMTHQNSQHAVQTEPQQQQQPYAHASDLQPPSQQQQQQQQQSYPDEVSKPTTYSLNPHKPLAPIPSSTPVTPSKPPPGTPRHPSASRVRAALQRAEQRASSRTRSSTGSTGDGGCGGRRGSAGVVADVAMTTTATSSSGGVFDEPTQALGRGDANPRATSGGSMQSSTSSRGSGEDVRGCRSAPTARPTTAVGARTYEGVVDEAFRAVKFGHADVLYYYLSRGLVTFDAVDGLGRTLLFVAALHKRTDVLRFLLDNAHYFDINTRAASGNTALHAAVTAESEEVVQMLLQAGADPAITNPETGDATPLDLAKMMDHEGIVKLLEASGSTASTSDDLGHQQRPTTASQLARGEGREDVAETLDKLSLEPQAN